MPAYNSPEKSTPMSAKPFKLIRYFSIASLAGIVVITIALITFYQELTLRQMITHQNRASADLTQIMANTVWRRYRDIIVTPEERTREEILSDPRLDQLHLAILGKIGQVSIFKVKIYNARGMTVFSTNRSQIGRMVDQNPGFLSAMAGETKSHISHRAQFDPFEREVNDLSLVSSYVPVSQKPGDPPEAVFEVYSDITEMVDHQGMVKWMVAAVVLILLSGLYLFLLTVVKKAARIIAEQEAERSEREALVNHLAHHDPLTQLPNRVSFSERLTDAIGTAKEHEHQAALMFVDLDRFKHVNDSLGHQVGDNFLQEISRRIVKCLGPTEQLFRMGGDEFTVIVSKVQDMDDVRLLADQIIEAVSMPFELDGHELVCGASIGIAACGLDQPHTDPVELLRNADAAMYAAKTGGGYRVYSAEMNLEAKERLELEKELRRAMRDDEFELYYQPRLDAATREVVGVEALLRWNSSQRGVLPAGLFIDVIEDMGLMPRVGDWVLAAACEQIARWDSQGVRDLRVSVNVSTLQFENSGFVQKVETAMNQFNVKPELLELELTESMLIRDPGQAKEQIGRLKALGVSIAIDDFGTGYSSLSYLKDFDVDCLKIDRHFVKEVANTSRDRAVASAIVALGNALGLKIVAEGVETESQALFFADGDGGELQGFLFSEALPDAQLLEYLSTNQSLHSDKISSEVV